MIADKVLKSFYIIEVEGNAINAIISGDFGIEKITLASGDFSSDLSATLGIQQCMDFIVNTIESDIDWGEVTENIDFNPEFFPSLDETFAKKQDENKNKLLQEMETDLEEGQVAIPITRSFDQAGDYIESHWNVDAPNFKIRGKVGINPALYLQHKVSEALFNTQPSQPVIH